MSGSVDLLEYILQYGTKLTPVPCLLQCINYTIKQYFGKEVKLSMALNISCYVFDLFYLMVIKIVFTTLLLFKPCDPFCMYIVNQKYESKA